MSTNVTLDIRCGHCNKKLSEVIPPVTLMIQRIKCPRCSEIVETYIIKPTNEHKPKETPRYNPVTETQAFTPDELKQIKQGKSKPDNKEVTYSTVREN